LAGRRLFLGKTDFDTVKQVQEAKVPSLSAINASVPTQLEKIVGHALAKRPSNRYSSARDLGRDLTTFLYHFGRPVSAFDVADAVQAMRADKRQVPREKASIIDKLIEEALLAFTSLQEDHPAPTPAVPEPPAKEGFEYIGQWANELGVAPTLHPRAPTQEVEATGPKKDSPSEAAAARRSPPPPFLPPPEASPPQPGTPAPSPPAPSPRTLASVVAPKATAERSALRVGAGPRFRLSVGTSAAVALGLLVVGYLLGRFGG
jgi:serine/threonine-protein kinase